MRTTLTAKLKLTTTPEQFVALRTTQLAYRNALNCVSAYAFTHGKTSGRRKLKKRFRGLDKAPHYVSPTLSYVYGRDYSLCTGHQVSLLTLSGRIHVGYQGYRKHVALLQQGAHLGGARNICLRALCIWQDWVHTGQLSDAPDVTDREDIRCTPLTVCRVAVESGHKLISPSRGVSL